MNYGQPAPNLRPAHRRALSDSTIQDARAENESDAGAFKIVISKPGDDQRPKTTEDLDPNAMPHLSINIPTWRIGIPRFTSTGTPLIRGSSYAPSFAQSDEMQSIRESPLERSQRDIEFSLPSLGQRRPSTLQVPRTPLSRLIQRRSQGLASPKTHHPLRATFMSTKTVIEAPMYDDLTFKPACDDRAIVRYAASSGAITAATPPRLVAEITSPSFLDYDLISDFFLTFRSFLEPDKLLRMLVARLRWACARNDEIGMIVHVRSFVALRHWVLNYFMDDFVADYDLRDQFCDLVNDLADELDQGPQDRRAQLKILGELKKCWRRVSAHYWDGPELEDTVNPNHPILPGGIAGHRDSNLDPSFWKHEESQAPRIGTLISVPEGSPPNFSTDVSRSGHVVDSGFAGQRPATPEHDAIQEHDEEFGPMSPTSPESLDILSCSFPGKNLRNLQPHSKSPMAAHPVPSGTAYNQTEPVATTPKSLVGKRVRPSAQHPRHGSAPGSPDGHSPQTVIFKEHEFTMAFPHAGSLVRGDVMPPGQAFVEIAPSTQMRHTVIFPSDRKLLQKPDRPADAMSGRGMRKLIGSVRRVLSTRGPAANPTQGQFGTTLVPGQIASATTNRLPGTAVVPQTYSGPSGARPNVRIDLLGAKVAEDFQRAVREDEAADAEHDGQTMQAPHSSMISPSGGGSTEQHGTTDQDNSTPRRPPLRPSSDAALTRGSKSIVIVDDTAPSQGSEPDGLHSSSHSIAEAFADTLMVHDAQITPPITPPANRVELARRSSQLLNENIQSVMRQGPSSSLTSDPIGLDNDHEAATSERSDNGPRPGTRRSLAKPPLSAGLAKIHTRSRSTKTQQSLNSILHRTEASRSSDLMPPSTIQSLDATTYTRYSLMDDDIDAPLPLPVRALRRRPGGDLRAATNVDELDRQQLRRSQSMGSLSVFTESIRSSMIYSQRANSTEDLVSANSIARPRRHGAFSVGQLTDKPAKKKELSLCSTRSSKPVMRPSFEAEAKKLAQIPDDDDNGVESALLKLEGKFEKPTPKLSMDLKDRIVTASPDQLESETTSVATTDIASHRRAMSHDDSNILWEDENSDDGSCAEDEGIHNLSARPNNHLDVPRASTAGQESFLSDTSRESYSSVPLLERGLTDDGRSNPDAKNWTDKSMFQEDDNASPGPATALYDEQRKSFTFIQKTDTQEHDGSKSPAAPTTEDESFLDSDLSSELSAEEAPTEVTAQPLQSFSANSGLPTHALAPIDTAPGASLPSPPTTNDMKPDLRTEPMFKGRVLEYQDLSQKPLPPTPDATPGGLSGPQSPFEHISRARAGFEPLDQESDATRKYSAHLPFVLAFDSETLAQQFTLIEKDALNEIDWKELVDMDWRNAKNHDSRSWVDFLRNSDAQGVEVVIARFNLVVKWVISEIVLTQRIEERARCIIKYIHIAGQCRRYRNFATMAQLTIALSSNEVSRLARTWELVPPQDMQTFRDLENLVTPMRNFLNLRAEMESGTDTGCIPFVGIYTHDLLYNGQRPSEIASSPTGPPLVNFERCRIGAGVVKTMLRLLEASAHYDFQPIEGITERCLWIGALPDDEIRRHSGNLE